jgi:type IV pilus assembly protein PilX
LAVGASYGQFTNALPVAGSAHNPTLLANQARYWIEVLQYGNAAAKCFDSVSNTQAGKLVPSEGLVFRITALATGLKPNTTAVVQSLYMFQDPAN